MKKEKAAIIKIDKVNFFFKWIEFTKPFHGLRKQLQDLLAWLLVYHYDLSLVIQNEKILWKQVFDYDTKVEIMNKMNIQQSTMENLLTQLRKEGVIENNKIKPAYVPNIEKNTTDFIIKINFKFNEPSGGKVTKENNSPDRVNE